MHELLFLLGLSSPNEWPYLFWSGIGGVLRDLLAAAAFLAIHLHFKERRGDA